MYHTLEFTPFPRAGYFGDFNNQPAKLARYGAGVKTASMKFMGAIITGERMLVSLA